MYTGDGGGKTAAALGIAMRALGHGMRVVLIQFMKGRPTGEAMLRLKNFEVYRFGRPEFVDPEEPEPEDFEEAERALKKAEEVLKTGPDILILDEVNVAVSFGLIPADRVVKLLERVPERTSVFLTGRYPPPELVRVSDFVTEITDLKRPEKPVFRKGIEY